MNTVNLVVWLAAGLIAVWPLLIYANKKSLRTNNRLWGRGLIIAALIYVLFAVIWGSPIWILVEAVGVGVYGLFYWLSSRGSMTWLAVGWLLHPVWDALLHLAGPGAHVAPDWYAIACISFDIAVAIYLLIRIKNGDEKRNTAVTSNA